MKRDKQNAAGDASTDQCCDFGSAALLADRRKLQAKYTRARAILYAQGLETYSASKSSNTLRSGSNSLNSSSVVWLTLPVAHTPKRETDNSQNVNTLSLCLDIPAPCQHLVPPQS